MSRLDCFVYARPRSLFVTDMAILSCFQDFFYSLNARVERSPRNPGSVLRDGVGAMLTYGCGLRLTECASLRIRDIDLERGVVIVRASKGDKDRRTVLPERLKDPLVEHLAAVRSMYENDLKQNIPGVYLPGTLEKKYPNAGKEWGWGWFWFFPSASLSIDPRTLIVRRHHMHPASLQRAFREALHQTTISKQASVHTLRHSFATHLLENAYDIRTIQELLGHQSLQTTMIYTRVASKNILGVRSPLDK